MKKVSNDAKTNKRRQSGITLVALIVTIIVMIILASVSVSLLLGENGLITRAKNAAQLMENAQIEEQERLDNLHAQMQSMISGYNTVKKVNIPKLLVGMTPIKFTLPTGEGANATKGEVVRTYSTDVDWYEYGTEQETRRWANAVTKDGSMWVWIPRYAYKITYYTNSAKTTLSENNAKTLYGKIDVVFLIGTTNNYYKKVGEEYVETIATADGYTVHPAFTNDIANGGWSKELTGIWVAKFEAGYASGNNTATPVQTAYNYENKNSNQVYTPSGWASARNYLNGTYGSTETKITYPVFMPTTYSINYMSISDMFKVSKSLGTSGNPYGLSGAANSHLMKNSEWGAVAYLAYSEYGTNGVEIKINNANINNANVTINGETRESNVYAITGCTDGSTENSAKTVAIANLNNTTGNTATEEGIYTWNQVTGGLASTTKNIYGIYDLSGGLWEYTASFISNGRSNLATYGQALKTETGATTAGTGNSTAYATIYPYVDTYTNSSSADNERSTANYNVNTSIYGDSVRETSTAGIGSASWNGDYSYFPEYNNPFFRRGGRWDNGSDAGSFAFNRSYGNPNFSFGFRCVLAGS